MKNAIYTGPPIDDHCTFELMPAELQARLSKMNGCVAFKGGLHMRGVCKKLLWHSIENVWRGEYALFKLFSTVLPTDIPFAQDCLGDQFLLRDSVVYRLSAETGEVQSMEVDLDGFFTRVEEDPVGFLMLSPLILFLQQGGKMEPGQSLSVYPPFCCVESSQGISVKAIDTLQLLMAHAQLAQAISKHQPGDKLNIYEIMMGD
ncbi:MAG: hypothetical protein ABFD64_10170 [Armatimonadota bacterium]